MRDFREPDLLVALGRPDDARLIYLLSEEGKAPDFVLEVLSETTHSKDTGEKRRWYRRIGVREYVVADPEGLYAGERRLQRWRLEEDPESSAPPDVGHEGEIISSAVLPYGLVVRDGWVRWVDPALREELPLLREQLAQGRREAALRRVAEGEARHELEQRLAAQAEARHELEQRLAAQAEARVELERRLSVEARLSDVEARAAAEAAARLVAEEEITRLRRALKHRAESDDVR